MNYGIAPPSASEVAPEPLDLLELIQRHQLTALVRSLMNTNPGFVRAFAEAAIRGAQLGGGGRAVLARLGPVPHPSEKAEAESAYWAMARDFNAGQGHLKQVAELLIETIWECVQ